MSFTVGSVDFIFEAGPLLFQLSSYFYAYISRTKRGVTFTLTLDRHVTSSFITRWQFPRKSPLFLEILPPEYWNNRDRLMSSTVRSVDFIFEAGPLLFQLSNYLHAYISRTKRGVILILTLNRHVISPLLTRSEFPRKSPFFSEILRPEYWNNTDRLMSFTVGSVDFIFEGGALLFQLSNYFYAYISRTKRGVTFTLTLDRHVISSFLTRWEFPCKSSFFSEILPPEYWNNKNRLMSFTIRSVDFIFKGGHVLFQHWNDFHAYISRTNRGVILILTLNRHVISSFLTRWEFPSKSPFFSEILPPEYWNNGDRLISSTVRSVDFIFEGKPLLFQLSSYFYAYNSRTKRGVTFTLTLDRHMISSFLTRWEFPRKSSLFSEILPPEYWNNTNRLMSFTIRSADFIFVGGPLLFQHWNDFHGYMNPTNRGVILILTLNRHVISSFLTR